MYVQENSVESHATLIDTWGKPTPSQRRFTEIVGRYGYGNDDMFWTYNPKIEAWSVQQGGNQRFETLALSSKWTACQEDNLRQAMLSLQDLVPPPIPARVNRKTRTAPFVFEGCVFQWIFFPELARWEIAPKGIVTTDRNHELRLGGIVSF